MNISALIYRSSAADVNLPSEGTKNKGGVPVLKATKDNLNDIQYHDLDDRNLHYLLYYRPTPESIDELEGVIICKSIEI